MTKENLQGILRSLHMTQAELAERIGRHPRSVRRYLSGDKPIPLVVEIAVKAIAEKIRQEVK